MKQPPKTFVLVVPWEITQINGGVNEIVRNIAAGIRKFSNLEPFVIENNWAASSLTPKKGYDWSGGRFRLTTPIRASRGVLGAIKWAINFPLRALKITRSLRQLNCAAIGFHYTTSQAIDFALLKKLGLLNKPLIISFHGADVKDVDLSSTFKKWVWNAVLHSADSITGCSKPYIKFAKEKIPERFHEKIVLMPNGFRDELFTPESYCTTAKEVKFPEGSTVITSVATYEHKKAQDVLLKSFKSLVNKHTNLHLCLIGRKTPFFNEVSDLVTRLKLEDKVTLLDVRPHSEVMDILQRSDLFCLPSRDEPFGIATLEAAMLGCPVVCAEVGGIPEIVKNEKSGLLVPPDDVDALTQALDRMICNPEQAQSFANALKKSVSDNFSWDASVKTYLKAAGVEIKNGSTKT